jgi:hypothetical protein
VPDAEQHRASIPPIRPSSTPWKPPPPKVSAHYSIPLVQGSPAVFCCPCPSSPTIHTQRAWAEHPAPSTQQRYPPSFSPSSSACTLFFSSTLCHTREKENLLLCTFLSQNSNRQHPGSGPWCGQPPQHPDAPSVPSVQPLISQPSTVGSKKTGILFNFATFKPCGVLYPHSHLVACHTFTTHRTMSESGWSGCRPWEREREGEEGVT